MESLRPSFEHYLELLEEIRESGIMPHFHTDSRLAFLKTASNADIELKIYDILQRKHLSPYEWIEIALFLSSIHTLSEALKTSLQEQFGHFLFSIDLSILQEEESKAALFAFRIFPILFPLLTQEQQQQWKDDWTKYLRHPAIDLDLRVRLASWGSQFDFDPHDRQIVLQSLEGVEDEVRKAIEKALGE